MNAEDAFINSKERNVFVATAPARHLLEALELGLAHASPVVVLTGDAGLGKTTVMHEAAARWAERVHAAWLDASRTPVDGLFGETIRHFGGHFRASDQRPEQVGRFAHALGSIRERGLMPVLVVDDAHELDLTTLAELGRIESAAAATDLPFKLVLIGRPALEDQLADDSLQSLAARVGARGKIGPMTQVDTREYLAHRVEAAGGDSAHGFSRKAAREIHNGAAGVPSVVNALSDEAQRCANAAGTAMVGPEHVRAVIAAAFRSDAAPLILATPAEPEPVAGEPEAEPRPSGSHKKPSHKARAAIPEKPKVIASHKAPKPPASAATHVPPPPTKRPSVPPPSVAELDSSSPRVRDWVSRFTAGQPPIRFGGRIAPPSRESSKSFEAEPEPTPEPKPASEPVTEATPASAAAEAALAPEAMPVTPEPEQGSATVEPASESVAEEPALEPAPDAPDAGTADEHAVDEIVEQTPAIEPATPETQDAELEPSGPAPVTEPSTPEPDPVALEVTPEQLAPPPLEVEEAPAPYTPEPPPHEPEPVTEEDPARPPSLTMQAPELPKPELRHGSGNGADPAAEPEEPVDAPALELASLEPEPAAESIAAAAFVERRHPVPNAFSDATPNRPANPASPSRRKQRAAARRAERAAKRAAEAAARAARNVSRAASAPAQGSYMDSASPLATSSPAVSPGYAKLRVEPQPGDVPEHERVAQERFSDGPRSPRHARLLAGIITGLIMIGMAITAIMIGRRGGFDSGTQTSPITNDAEPPQKPSLVVTPSPAPSRPPAQEHPAGANDAATDATSSEATVDEPVADEGGGYCLAVGSYLFEERAQEEARTLRRRTKQRVRVVADGRGAERSYRVLFGAYASEDAAVRAADRLLTRGIVSEALVEKASPGGSR